MRSLLKRVKRRLKNGLTERQLDPVVRRVQSTHQIEPEPDEEPMDIEIEGSVLSEWINSGIEYKVIDIRESYELHAGVIKGSVHIPMNSIPSRLDEMPDNTSKVVIYCAHGVRSFSVTAWLRDQGWEDSWSLVGGMTSVPAELYQK